MIRIMTVLGTRSEAIKLSPIIKALEARAEIELTVCTTGQHREMLRQVLDLFDIEPTMDLAVMTPGQTLADITTRILGRLSEILAERPVDWLLVQGGTSTTFAASLAAYYAKIPVAHVEAGLRSGDIYAPWPEEVNRRTVSMIGALHFAPSEAARRNLLADGADPAAVLVTGNSVIDALLHFQKVLEVDDILDARFRRQFDVLDSARRLILVTGHRRENLDGGIERVCDALLEVANRDDLQIAWPLHPNPNVRGPVGAKLADHPNIQLLDPLDYLPFVYLMTRSHVIVTDSGSIQEEAPALGKPVLVTRETTERPEGVAAGTARLVGTDRARIVTELTRLLDDQRTYETMSRAHNPYGDGRSSERIVQALLERDDGLYGALAASRLGQLLGFNAESRRFGT